MLVVVLAVVLVVPQLIQPDATASSVDDISFENRVLLNCDLNETDCHYQSTLFGDVSVSVSPKAFPAFKPIAFSVNVDRPIDEITISLQGKEMYMGLNQAVLVRNGSQWQGEGMIPVCSVDSNMIWLVIITLSGKGVEQLVFEVSSAH